MSWTDKFRKGSFRGVAFFVDKHELSSGRRFQNHEFPQRDKSRSEDLGRKIRKFTLDLFVLGEDYFEDRDALIAALETEGPGELIHPYLGRKVVQAGSFTVSESRSERRIATFATEFQESGQLLFPESVEDETQKALDNADEVIEESKSFLESAYDVANQPARIVNAASDLISGVSDAIEDSVKKFTQPIADLSFAISNLKADANDLARNKTLMGDRMSEVIGQLLSEFEDDEDTSQKILGNLATFGDDLDPVVGTTPTAERQSDNQDAIVNFTKQQALANQSKAAVQVAFVSAESAVEVRDSIFSGLDTQLEQDISDDLFQSVRNLQASMTETIPAAIVGETISFTPRKTIPAIVVAHRLFNDIGKEQDVIDQNSIRHPGFVPGNQALEVSSG
jgi:prophage DNA circulation protein